MREFNKIFCIGMNKTGTTSLHHAFISLGIPSLHGSPDGIKPDTIKPRMAKRMTGYFNDRLKRGVRNPLGVFDVFSAFGDLRSFIDYYYLLDKEYPESLFIYTDRDDKEWVESRRNHLKLSDYDSKDRAWLAEKHEHKEGVLRYFEGRADDLLVIDICAGDGFNKLCPFLELPTIEEAFPKKNVKRKTGC